MTESGLFKHLLRVSSLDRVRLMGSHVCLGFLKCRLGRSSTLCGDLKVLEFSSSVGLWIKPNSRTNLSYPPYLRRNRCTKSAVRSCVALLQFWHINQKPELLRVLLEHAANPEKLFLDFLHQLILHAEVEVLSLRIRRNQSKQP